MDYRIEAITLPVSDVDRARAFYEQAGWHLDGAAISAALMDQSGRHRSICGKPRIPSVWDSSPQW